MAESGFRGSASDVSGRGEVVTQPQRIQRKTDLPIRLQSKGICEIFPVSKSPFSHGCSRWICRVRRPLGVMQC